MYMLKLLFSSENNVFCKQINQIDTMGGQELRVGTYTYKTTLQ